ncbi:hypothetical protein BASA81_000774 [Batrachochytrium salamandrivorans]|nr:hypothetical protein BASA81_000774 [Batrachochytrium salamandrivorans]
MESSRHPRTSRGSPKSLPRKVGDRWNGRVDCANGSSFVGDLLQLTPELVVKDGYGVFVDEAKRKTYEGWYFHDQKHGFGVTKYQDMIHQGQYCKNLRHGFGTFTCFTSGMTYEGEFRYGEFHGQGKLFLTANRLQHSSEGQFRKGQFVRGVKTTLDGKRFTGELVNELESGYGTTQFANGNIHQGFYSQGKPHGRGELYSKVDDQWWRGNFCHGAKDLKLPFIQESNGLVFVGIQSQQNRGVMFGRLDGDENAHELGLDLCVTHRMGEFVHGELVSGSYTTAHMLVTAQEFDVGPCVRDSTFASWHDNQSNNVRFARLGPKGDGPIGKALFAFAERAVLEARVEMYKIEGQVHESVQI